MRVKQWHLETKRTKKRIEENLALLAKLLVVWFIVSFGAGIIFVDILNEIQFFGFKLGFWFAQRAQFTYLLH